MNYKITNANNNANINGKLIKKSAFTRQQQQQPPQQLPQPSIEKICDNLNNIIGDLKKIENSSEPLYSQPTIFPYPKNMNQNLFLNISTKNHIAAGTNKPQNNNSTNFWISQLRK